MRVVGNYGTSLLNMLDSDVSSSTTNALAGLTGTHLSAGARKTLAEHGINIGGIMSNNASSAADKTYENVRNATDSLRDNTAKLSGTSQDSIYAEAEKNGSNKKIVEQVTEFVENYNDMILSMNKMGGSVNSAYERDLKVLYKDNKELLENIGITMQENGTFKIDEEKINNASLDDIKKVFQGDNSYGDKVAYKSMYIEANAVSAMAQNRYASATSSYTQNGQFSASSNYALSNFLKNI